MEPHSVQMLLREGMTLIAIVGGPIFLALLVSGLVIGVLQASTQIQDPAIGFLPRLVVAAGVSLLLGGWMVERLAQFFASSLSRMGAG